MIKKIKNKLSLLIAVIILVFFFGSAAICNTCSINDKPKTVTTVETTETISEENTDLQTTEQEMPVTESEQEQFTIETSADISTVIHSGAIDGSKRIALTFDSGWEFENTKSLLDLLDDYGISSTFFVRGMWVKDYPELAKEIVSRGHALENHSLNHGHMVEMTESEIENEVRGAAEIIFEETGYVSKLFRPPYGEYDDRVLKILKSEGYDFTVMWTVDSHDWAEELNGVEITREYVVKRVLGNASDGCIVLMHVGGYKTIDALPQIISGLRELGYEMAKLNDML
jgi:peptidoglycan/xylan/chitin deacetylase (PgdA/CDA1 family)